MSKGFTLIELLLALFIFSLLALLLSQGLHTVLEASKASDEIAADLREKELALLLFSRDIEEAKAPLIGDRKQLHFFISSSPTEVPHYREYQQQSAAFLRRTGLSEKETALSSRSLLTTISQLEFRYLGKNRVFYDHWPAESQQSDTLPLAVALRLTFKEGSVLEQLYLVHEVVFSHAT